MKRQCAVCETVFDTSRANARYCSARCRASARAERQRAVDQGDRAGVAGRPQTVDEARIRELQAALARAGTLAGVDLVLGWAAAALSTLTSPGQTGSYAWRLLRVLFDGLELRERLAKPAEPVEPAEDPGVAQLHALQAKAAARRARYQGSGDEGA